MKKSLLFLPFSLLIVSSCSETSSSLEPSTSLPSTTPPISSSTPSIPDPTITLEDYPETLYLNESYKISYTVTDYEDEVIITSSDESVVKVEGDVLTSQDIEGSATIAIQAGETREEFTVTVSPTLPDLKTAISNLVNTQNYTLNVTKNGDAYETLYYTPYAINLTSTASEEVKRYALSSIDGLAFTYEIEDGAIVPGERMVDLSGYITQETFHGNSSNPYYFPIVGLGAVDTSVLPTEGENNVYQIELTSPDSDRDSSNQILLCMIGDYDTYDMLFSRPYNITMSIEVKGYYDLTITYTCGLRGKETSDYVIEVDDITQTEIDDGIKDYIKVGTGLDRVVPSALTGSVNQLKEYNNYCITDDYSYQYIVTENYTAFSYLDDYFGPYYDPENYNYNGSGYIKLEDGIYSYIIPTTYDIDSDVITRGDIVLGEKVEGTDSNSSLIDTLCYFSTWAALEDEKVFSDTTEYMAATFLGYANGNKELANDTYEKASKFFPADIFAPWGAEEGQSYVGYRTHVLTSNYNEDPSLSTVGIMVGYQVKEVQEDKSSSYNYMSYYVRDFGTAKDDTLEDYLS